MEPALSLRLYDSTTDESDRIAAAVAGDESAVAWLVEQYTPMTYRFALRTLRNEQDARDAAQDAMVKVIRNLHRYDDQWRFVTWVLSITRNTCIDEFRKRKRRSEHEIPDIADASPGPEELTARGRRSQHLHAALQDVPPLYREVLELYHFENLKYREIADLLDLPIGTVMNRIFRARQKLREAYERTEAAGAPV